MSLDVHLMGPKYKVACVCHDCGNKHKKTEREELYWSNITHNLNKMADKAGIYKHLWRPDELGIKKAKKLIKPLEEGLKKMKSNRKFCEQYNATNGWGLYEHFVPWVEEYLAACKKFPDSDVVVSR